MHRVVLMSLAEVNFLETRLITERFCRNEATFRPGVSFIPAQTGNSP